MKKRHTLYVLSIFLLLAENVYAYLDPGTGSMLLQGLIAAIAGGLVAIKLYWHKVKSFLFSHAQEDNSSADSPTDNVPEEENKR